MSLSTITKAIILHRTPTYFLRPCCLNLTRHFTSDISQPPKKPRGAYVSFFADKISSLRQDHPKIANKNSKFRNRFLNYLFNDRKSLYIGLKVPDLGKMAGEMWRALPVEEKTIYKEKAKVDSDRYKQDQLKYITSLTTDELDELRTVKKAKKAKLAKRRLKKLSSDLNRPKAPNSAFGFYIARQQLHRGSLTPAEFVKKMAVQWKSLSAEQKQPYIDQVEKDRIQFQEELEKWEERMVQEGHPELLRKSSPHTIKTVSKKPQKKKSKKKVASKKTAKKVASKKTAKRATSMKTAKKTPKKQKKVDEDPGWMREE